MAKQAVGYSDLPATIDELGFAPSAAALAAIIQQSDTADTPLTIGVFGPWGSGKTSMMRMVLERLEPARCTTVWFDAWRYAQQEALWRALLLHVVESLRRTVAHDDAWLHRYIVHRNRLDPTGPQIALDKAGIAQTTAALDTRFEDLIASLYRSVDREEAGALEFQWDEAGKLAAGAVIRAGFSYLPILGSISKAVEKANEELGGEAYADKLFALFQRERTRIYRQHVQSLEQFHQNLTSLINDLVIALDQRLVICIDDLDRCLPEQAISVLEAIKVFLDIPGCIFVLGVDREIIERGIRVRYKEFALSGLATALSSFPVAERDYLEKIVQIPFSLPPLDPAAIRAFLVSRLPTISGLGDDEAASVADLMVEGLLRNPRKVKRTLNVFRLHFLLDRAHGRTTAAGLIAKLTVMQSSFALIYDHVAHDPMVLKSIEQSIRGLLKGPLLPELLSDEVKKADPRFGNMLYKKPLFQDLTDDQLRELVYQSQVTASDDKAP